MPETTEVQTSLLPEAKTKRPRTIRKTRDDKGKKRKPDPTAKEQAMLYFAGLDIPGKQRFIEDCSLILRFCDPEFRKAFNDYVPLVPPHDHEWERKTVDGAPCDRCRKCGITMPMKESGDAAAN